MVKFITMIFKFFLSILTLLLSFQVYAVTTSTVGKEDWLFYKNEIFDNSAKLDISQNIDLVSKINKLLKMNEIELLVTLVPLKMRIYSEKLEPNRDLLNPFMEDNYENVTLKFSQEGVYFANLNEAFLKSSEKNSTTPLYFKYDTHWSPSGGMLAAQTLKSTIENTPALKDAFEKTAITEYNLFKGGIINWPKGDLTSAESLPPGYVSNGIERGENYSTFRRDNKKVGLFDGEDIADLIEVGSSYSKPWTLFPEALQFTLQRNPAFYAITADKGSWYAMLSMLQDSPFQKQRPKLVIWEILERELKVLPDYPYREDRYKFNNQEWLYRASALIEKKCRPSNFELSVVNKINGRQSKETDFVEVVFPKGSNKMNYLSFYEKGTSLIKVQLFTSEKNVATMTFELPASKESIVKVPLYSTKGFVSKIRIFPGVTPSFKAENFQICNQPEAIF